MKITDALIEVSRAYPPGTGAYYARFTPDPWQEAHDRLGNISLLMDEEIVTAAAQRFVSECRDLIEQFKSKGKPSKGVSHYDQIALGPSKNAAAWQSVKYHECYACHEKGGLVIESYGENALQVRVVCSKCKGRAA